MRGDFIGFTYNGHHSEDFNLMRVSSGDRLTSALFAELKDKTVDVSGKEGSYYFGTQVGNKPIDLNVAFDNIDEKQFNQLQKWLSGKKLSKFIYDEFPYKYYLAKISENPEINFIPFEEYTDNGVRNVYKGEMRLRFRAYEPYGYSNNIDLTSYKDYNGNNYNLEYLPLWEPSGELIPKCDIIESIRKPQENNYFYLGGLDKTKFNLKIKFNTKEEIIEAIKGDIQQLERYIEELDATIAEKNSEIANLVNSIETTKQQIKDYQDLIVSNSDKIEDNNKFIVESTNKLPILEEDINEQKNLLDLKDKEILNTEKRIEELENLLSELQKSLDDLLAVENPNISILEKIEQLNKEKADKEEQKVNEERTLSTQKEERIEIEQKYNDLIEEKETLSREIENKTNENVTLTRDINNAKISIANLKEQIKVPSGKIEELTNEITSLTEQKNETELQVQILKTEGVPLDGEELNIVKDAQYDSEGNLIDKERKCTIKLEDFMKGKVIEIKATNKDIAAYDENGVRYDLFNNMSGDYIMAEPNGVYDIIEGEFNADASFFNEIRIDKLKSEEERLSWAGKYAVFKEDSKIGGKYEYTASKIISVLNSTDEYDTIVLENGYSLTKGKRHIVIINSVANIKFDNIKFLKEIVYDFHYKYY